MTYNLKSAKIGGTINFGSAGSFSFSFGAEIGSPEDYLRLVEQGASSLLGQFRDADEETKSAVRAYIARLCSIPEDRVPVVQPAQKSAPVEEPEPAPVRAPEPTPIAPPKPAPAGGGQACEVCGKTISQSQAQLSKLFADRPLCKACLEGGK